MPGLSEQLFYHLLGYYLLKNPKNRKLVVPIFGGGGGSSAVQGLRTQVFMLPRKFPNGLANYDQQQRGLWFLRQGFRV